MEKEAPIHASNVQLFNPATNQADKVSIRTLEDGRKVRVLNPTAKPWISERQVEAMSRLQTYYKDTVVPDLMKELDLSNVMEVPRITKVTTGPTAPQI